MVDRIKGYYWAWNSECRPFPVFYHGPDRFEVIGSEGVKTATEAGAVALDGEPMLLPEWPED